MNGLAVLGGVVQLDFAAGALLGGINDAGVEGARIYMQADGALVEIPGIEDPVNRSERVDGARVRLIHLDGFSGLDGALAGGNILMDDVKIFHLQAATADGHPPVLLPLVLAATARANFPPTGT